MSTHISVVGTVATDPRYTRTASQIPVCSFRLASNERRYDRDKGEWVDGETNWFTVTGFRGLASNAHQSFSKGDRVLVSGRLRIRDWSSGEKSGTTAEIDAEAFGHDLRWGISSFRKKRNGEATDSDRDRADSDTSEITPVPTGNGWGAPDRPEYSDETSTLGSPGGFRAALAE